MTQKKYLKIILIVSFISMSLVGFIIHFLFHPISKNPSNYIPFITGLISIFAISTMFFFKKLVPYAYILNGIIAIIGTITMAHFGFAHPPEKISVSAIFFSFLIPDIIFLWVTFFLGKLIFELELTNTNNLDSIRHKGRFFRYPNLGFWAVHLVAFSIVYYLGHILWK